MGKNILWVGLWLFYSSFACAVSLNLKEYSLKALGTTTPLGVDITTVLKQSPESMKAKLSLEKRKVSGEVRVALQFLDTGLSLRNKHLYDLIKVSEHPEAIFTFTHWIIPRSQGKLSVEGLPFKGNLQFFKANRPIEGLVKMEYDGKKIQATFHFEILLSQFGITPPSFMGVRVRDKVSVEVTLGLELEKEEQQE